jgi:hypothetical protein
VPGGLFAWRPVVHTASTSTSTLHWTTITEDLPMLLAALLPPEEV